MFRIVVFVSIFVIASLGYVVLGQRAEVPAQPDQEIKPIVAPPSKQTLRTQRHREGTAFKDALVYFKQNGDRTVLYTVGKNQRFTCLENLALDRILTTIQAKPGREFWKIEGEFTEFRGENLVLIRRAVVAYAPATDVPAAP
ncbi:MAG: hypothetical protein LBI05_06830 [Planctomycetaceae bacterium]|nr:hypothetical protein [Planctomycetaceae bacterium]